VLMADLKIWLANRENQDPNRALVVNIRCCTKYNWTTSVLIRLWMLSILVRVLFGVLLALPAGSSFLPFWNCCCILADVIFLLDWKFYYIDGYYNGLLGVYYNPWTYLIMSMILQSIFCFLLVFGHFIFHYHCIYHPSRTVNICYDWLPYEFLLCTYLGILVLHFYYDFQGQTHSGNKVSLRVYKWLRFSSLIVFICIVWMIVEFLDEHTYVYDVTAFVLLWFVVPVWWTLLTKFKVQQ
jgi:hypothetical protein